LETSETIKYLEVLSSLFQEKVAQAKEDKTPVLVLKAKNRKDDYMVVRLRDILG